MMKWRLSLSLAVPWFRSSFSVSFANPPWGSTVEEQEIQENGPSTFDLTEKEDPHDVF
jgi:hypothetical protein